MAPKCVAHHKEGESPQTLSIRTLGKSWFFLLNSGRKVEFEIVVTETDNTFNQITDDQATEHTNRKAKVGGGLVGIQSESACTKWCLTCSDKAQLAEDTNTLLGAARAYSDVNEEQKMMIPIMIC